MSVAQARAATMTSHYRVYYRYGDDAGWILMYQSIEGTGAIGFAESRFREKPHFDFLVVFVSASNYPADVPLTMNTSWAYTFRSRKFGVYTAQFGGDDDLLEMAYGPTGVKL